MRTLPILIAVHVVVLAGCANPGRALPTCDGKHLRPANLHGSVLDLAPLASSTAGPADPTGVHASCGQ